MKLTKVQFVTISKNVAFRKLRVCLKKLKAMQNFKIYCSFLQPKSPQKNTYHLMMMLKHIRKQLAQHRLIGETTQGICIQEVTNNVVDNQMQLDYEGSDQELEEIEVVDNLKPVDVMHMLEQIKTMTITSTDRKFVENCDYIHKKVQEMLSGNAIRKGGLKYFAKFTGKHLCQNLFFNKVAGLRPAILLKKETSVFL